MRELITIPMVWVDGSSARFWLIGAPLATLAVFLAVFGARQTVPIRPQRRWTHPGWFALALGLGLLFFRLPGIACRTSFIEDEAAFISGALTLTHDPVFWRSVQSTTSGPLNYYLLLVPWLCGFPLDFLGARLLAAAAAFGMILVHYAMVRRLFDDNRARLLTLPIWGFFTTVSYFELLSYHSEYVALVLLQLASYSLVRWWQMDSWAWLGCAGLLLGWLPWAKLQAVPAGCGLACLGLAAIAWKGWPRTRRLLPQMRCFILVGLLPTALVFLYAWAFAVWDDMWLSYIRWNIHLAEKRSGDLSLWTRTMELLRTMNGSFDIDRFSLWWLATIGVAVALRPRILLPKHWGTAFFPLLAAATSFSLLTLAIVLSGKVHVICFAHYLLFLFFPMALVEAIVLGLAMQAPPEDAGPVRKLGGATLVLRCMIVAAALHMFWVRWTTPDPLFRLYEPLLHHADYYRHDFLQNPLASEILTYSQPSEPILVWGWAPRYYVMTQHHQATSYGVSEQEFDDFEKQYFLDKLLDQLQARQPPVILDETGEGSGTYRSRLDFGHERVPRFNEFIQSNYRLVRDRKEGRLYVRKDILASLPTPRPIAEWAADIRVVSPRLSFSRWPCFAVAVANRGTETWYPFGETGTDKGKVSLQFQLCEQDGQTVLNTETIPLRQPVAPGEKATLSFETNLPRPGTGAYVLKLSLVQSDGPAANVSPSHSVPFAMFR